MKLAPRLDGRGSIKSYWHFLPILALWESPYLVTVNWWWHNKHCVLKLYGYFYMKVPMILLKRTELKSELEHLSWVFNWRKTQQQKSITSPTPYITTLLYVKQTPLPPPTKNQQNENKQTKKPKESLSRKPLKNQKAPLNSLKIYCAHEKFYELIHRNLKLTCIPGHKTWARHKVWQQKFCA